MSSAWGDWLDVRAVMAQVGQNTPRGRIEAIAYDGDLRRISLTIGGKVYERSYDTVISVQTPLVGATS